LQGGRFLPRTETRTGPSRNPARMRILPPDGSRQSKAALVTGLSVVLFAAIGCGARTGLSVFDKAAPDCTTAPRNPNAPDCDAQSTSLAGTVYDPAGKNPLYNVVVYVPGSTPAPLPSGATCDSCADLYTGSPVTTALTDANGRFFLSKVPPGRDVPLVFQIGKWRRQVRVPNVVACQETSIPDGSLTLPKNQTEGDIPAIAISTGGSDTLECLFRRIGVDASEYTGDPLGAGRIHIFQGSGNGGGTGAPTTAIPAPGASQSFSFNTPLAAPPPSQCGQVVYTAMHVGAGSNDTQGLPVPDECAAGDLSPQEKVLEFLVFNLSSCVMPAEEMPLPPASCP
jgi:hypothetical protein